MLYYDKNGNILEILRGGHLDTNAENFGSMDELSYSYDAGNKLLNVYEHGSTITGFKDGNTVGDDYSYDLNGNMTEDKNKRHHYHIAYNHLNLPTILTLVSVGSSTIFRYIYDATRHKTRKTSELNEIGHSSNYPDYAGNFVYQRQVPVAVLQYPRRAMYSPSLRAIAKQSQQYEYVYQYKDHLGNVRLCPIWDATGVSHAHCKHIVLTEVLEGMVGKSRMRNYHSLENGRCLKSEVSIAG